MRLQILRHGIEIITDSEQDLAFIEDTLKIKGGSVGIIMPLDEKREGRIHGLFIDVEKHHSVLPIEAIEKLPELWVAHLKAQSDSEPTEPTEPDQSESGPIRVTDLKLMDIDLNQIPKASMAKAFLTMERGEMSAADIERKLRLIGFDIERQAISVALSTNTDLFERVRPRVYRRKRPKSSELSKSSKPVKPAKSSKPVKPAKLSKSAQDGATVTGRIDGVADDWEPPTLPDDKADDGDAEPKLKELEVKRLARLYLRKSDNVVNTASIRKYLRAKGHSFATSTIDVMLSKEPWAKFVAEGHWRFNQEWTPDVNA